MLTFATRFVLKVVVGTNPIRFDLKTECPLEPYGPFELNAQGFARLSWNAWCFGGAAPSPTAPYRRCTFNGKTRLFCKKTRLHSLRHSVFKSKRMGVLPTTTFKTKRVAKVSI